MTSGKVATTLGYERRNNPALRVPDRDAFVRFMTADQPARPANIENIVAINQGRRPLTMEPPEPRPMTVAGFEAARREADHVVLDTRRGPQFAAGHVPGAVNVQLASPEFEQRVGWVTPPGARLLLILDRDEDAAAALKALAFVGLDARVAGHLAGGLPAWTAAGHRPACLQEIDVRDLHGRLARNEPLSVLDVREPSEWNAGHVPGSRQRSYRTLAGSAVGVSPAGGVLAVMCQSGGRSTTAASLLLRAGVTGVVTVAGGIQAWVAEGLAVERADAPRLA